MRIILYSIIRLDFHTELVEHNRWGNNTKNSISCKKNQSFFGETKGWKWRLIFLFLLKLFCIVWSGCSASTCTKVKYFAPSKFVTYSYDENVQVELGCMERKNATKIRFGVSDTRTKNTHWQIRSIFAEKGTTWKLYFNLNLNLILFISLKNYTLSMATRAVANRIHLYSSTSPIILNRYHTFRDFLSQEIG